MNAQSSARASMMIGKSRIMLLATAAALVAVPAVAQQQQASSPQADAREAWRFAIPGQDGFKWFALAQLWLLLDEHRDAVHAVNDLRVHGMFDQ
jgi:hypothetical protein